MVFCPLYYHPGAKFLTQILSGLNLFTDVKKITFLLSDHDAYVSQSFTVWLGNKEDKFQGGIKWGSYFPLFNIDNVQHLHHHLVVVQCNGFFCLLYYVYCTPVMANGYVQ